MRYFIIFCTSLLTLFFYSCSKGEDNLIYSDNSLLLPIAKDAVSEDFLVSLDLLNEYLSVYNKLSSVTSVIPLQMENDTLAYFVSYEKGWDIISADTRIESILASSDNSEGVVLDAVILEQQFAGLLEYIQSVRASNVKKVSRLWSYLQLKVISRSSICTKSPVARGRVAGMWVEVTDEPVYSEDEVIIPHIIAAKWSQRDPWDSLMPQKLDENGVIKKCPVGCGTVAAGQVIHHYRKTNSMGMTIPTSAAFANSSILNEYPIFSDFSSSHWNSMALNAYGTDINKKYTSVFLSYLAQQGNAQLSIDSTGMRPSNFKNLLNLYQLNFNESSSYNYQDIYYNLINGRPVIIVSEFNRVINDTEILDHHYYIIDRYKENINQLTTTYQWMPDYQPTEWELQTLPQWRFEGLTPDGRDILDVTISRTEDTYFGMNWGGYGLYIDNFYLVRSYISESEDEAGIVPSTEVIYTPMWMVNTNNIDEHGLIRYRAKNITNVFYNISDNNQ